MTAPDKTVIVIIYEAQLNCLRENILQLLGDHGAEGTFSETMEQLAEKFGSTAFSVLFNVLTSLDLADDEALKHWQAVLQHHGRLEASSGTEFPLRLAIFSYFCTVEKLLDNPRLVDIRSHEKTVQHSRHDHLTGLLNRRLFEEIFNREISRAIRHGNDLALLFFDIDDFKKINDTLGHPAGDAVLRWVADILEKNKRGEDIAVRFGGEEFVLLLPQTSKNSALVIGERIRSEIQKNILEFAGRKINITVSCGLAAYPYDAAAAENLLDNADQGLYLAKSVGKNTIGMISKNMRRYARIAYNRHIKIGEILPSGTLLHNVLAKNLSGNGLLFQSDREYQVDTSLQAAVAIDEDKPILLAGKIVHSRKTKPQHYDIGLSFHETDSATRLKLAAYIMGRMDMERMADKKCEERQWKDRPARHNSGLQ